MLLNSFKILKDRQKKFGWQNRRKSQQEKISIVISLYNEEKYVVDCIESIKRQSYTNIEIIIVDDASTDGSLSICEEIAKRDIRIALLAHNEHRGVAATRNTGIEAATGDFIMFMNADDMLEKMAIEEMKRACEVNRACISVCDMSFWYTGDIKKNSKYANGELEVISGHDFDMCYFMYPDTIVENISVWNKLFKAELFENIRFPVDSDYPDEATVFKLTNQSEKIAYVHQPLYISRTAAGYGTEPFTNDKYKIFDCYVDRMAFYQERAQFDMLWFTFKRCMYWLYKYKNMSKEAGCYDKNIGVKYIKAVKTYYKDNKSYFNLNAREKNQINLFMFSFGLYCKIKDLQG